jgi:hypothetical protein
MNATRATHGSKNSLHRKRSAIVACSLALAVLCVPSTAAAAGCTIVGGEPSKSGDLIKASGSAVCTSHTVVLEVCIERLERGIGVSISCATDTASSGEWARATATFPCVLPSAVYRSTTRADALNAQGDIVSSGMTIGGSVTLTCPVG